MARVQHTHSTESKYKAVQMYLEHGFGYKRVAKELGIPEASIRRWVKFYENEGMSGLEEKRGKSKGINKGRPRKNPLSPEEELISFAARLKSRHGEPRIG
jgi:transposase